MKTTLVLPFVTLALAVVIPCQAEPRPVQPTARTPVAIDAKAGNFVLEAGKIELAELIDRVAEYLGFNLLYSEAELASNGGHTGQIRLTRRTEVDRDGCWELFGSLLYHKGFAIVALDQDRGFYEVINTAGPRSREIASGAMFVPHTEVEAYAKLKAIPILTSVPLQNVNATIATNALRPFFAATGANTTSITLGNVGNNSDILLQGFGPQVAAACRLLRLVDIGDDRGNPQVQVVPLQHAAADDIVARLEETLGGRAMQNAMQAGMAMGSPLRAVAHPALNAVVLSGSTTQVRDGLELIARLDAPATQANPVSEDLVLRLQQLEQRVQKLEQGQRVVK